MTDKELIEGIKKGNQSSFKILVDKYQSLVLNTCQSFLHNITIAEDITQEVFIEVFLSIHKFKNEAKLATWLYRISVNKSLNHIRDNKKRNLVRSIENYFTRKEISDPENAIIEESDLQEERIQVLHQSINALSKNQKIAFTLSKFEDLSYLQISEVMHLSLSSVEGLIHRAKHKVQNRILGYYEKK